VSVDKGYEDWDGKLYEKRAEGQRTIRS